MGYLTKTVSAEVDIDSYDLIEYVEYCNKSELEDVIEAVEKRAKQLKIKGPIEAPVGVRLQVYCLPVEEFMAGQVQELITRLGIEDTLRALQAATR